MSKVQRYLELTVKREKKRLILKPLEIEEEKILEEMDKLWYGFSKAEIEEVEELLQDLLEKG